MTKSCLIISAYLLLSFDVFAQDGSYTVSFNGEVLKDNMPKLYLKVENSLILFGENNKLNYPNESIISKITSMVFVYKLDTICFFETDRFKNAINLPKFVTRSFTPDYASLFREKRNLCVNIDSYPFDENDIEFAVRSQAESDNLLVNNYYAVFIKYQIIEIRPVRINGDH